LSDNDFSGSTWHAAEATFAAYGGFAFAKKYDIERKWREARLTRPRLSPPT
jgi:acyl-CoA dehydrogenase